MKFPPRNKGLSVGGIKNILSILRYEIKINSPGVLLKYVPNQFLSIRVIVENSRVKRDELSRFQYIFRGEYVRVNRRQKNRGEYVGHTRLKELDVHTSRCADVGDEKQPLPRVHPDETLWKKVELFRSCNNCAQIIISSEILRTSFENLSMDYDSTFNDQIATLRLRASFAIFPKNFRCFTWKARKSLSC